MDDRRTAFLRNTWSAWRSGVVWPLGLEFAKAAQEEFETFVEKCALVKGRLLAEFFAANEPLPGEFFIMSRQNQTGSRLGTVLSSQRLWLFSNKTKDYVVLDMAEVAAVSSSPNLASYNIKVRFVSGRLKTYCSMLSLPPLPHEIDFVTKYRAMCAEQQQASEGGATPADPATACFFCGDAATRLGEISILVRKPMQKISSEKPFLEGTEKQQWLCADATVTIPRCDTCAKWHLDRLESDYPVQPKPEIPFMGLMGIILAPGAGMLALLGTVAQMESQACSPLLVYGSWAAFVGACMVNLLPPVKRAWRTHAEWKRGYAAWEQQLTEGRKEESALDEHPVFEEFSRAEGWEWVHCVGVRHTFHVPLNEFRSTRSA